ncbi:hypothetical protein AGMMS49938_01920 [Fibrobacterales bacterium]|nr:hypothetical protein AGMMS49938_01920 [Fibrobacterales bacterium]
MKPYFPALDGLRLLASLNIVLLHFSTSDLLTYAKNSTLFSATSTPVFNASVFFVLSGFIYSVIFGNPNRIPRIGNFMKERFFRLYPLHIVCTLLIFAITIYRTHILDNPEFALKTLALHISLLWTFVPNLGFHLNQPSWTLSVFFLCYSLTPAFCKMLNVYYESGSVPPAPSNRDIAGCVEGVRSTELNATMCPPKGADSTSLTNRPLKNPGHIVISKELPQTLSHKTMSSSLWGMFLFFWVILILCINYFGELPNALRGIEFFCGLVLGRLFLNGKIPLPKKAIFNDTAILTVCILLYLNSTHSHALHFINSQYSYHIISPLLYCILVVLLANNRGLFVQVLSLKWIRKIGKASFYTYLLHSVLIEFLHLYLDKVVHWKYNPFNNILATILLIIILYGTCTAYNEWKVRKEREK